MADTDEKVKEAKAVQSYAALSIGIICLLIGFPVWWKTTEVYRVSLPYSDIAQLADDQVHLTIYFHAIILTDVTSLTKLQEVINFEDQKSEKDSRLQLRYTGIVSAGSPEEMNLFKTAKSIKEFETELRRLKPERDSLAGNYTVYILPEDDSRIKLSFVVGSSRTSFIKSTTDVAELAGRIHNIIRNVFVKEDAVYKSLEATSRTASLKSDKDSMRALRSSPGYDVTFTLLNPQPDMVQASWDIESAVHVYMNPMLSIFNKYANVTVKSQYLHFTGLGVRAERTDSGSRLTSEQLPHIINPVEAYLGSHVSTNPNINFIVYVPTRDQSPLYIYDSSGTVLDSNAFLSPRWGGLLIYNVNTTDKFPVNVKVDMKHVLSVFLAQLRLILGIHATEIEELEIVSPGNKIITDWEMDQWLIERCIENVFTSAATLKSLAELLDKISNIVINDEIGAQVVTSVDSIKNSISHLEAGRLEEAFLASKLAHQSSEKAFFDPSLLELLYFPEDQKFAIYIPLFLPVGLPIVLSLIEAFKWLRGSKEKDKKD